MDNTEEIIEVEFQDILRISSGLDESGNPRSAGTLSILEVNGLENIQTEEDADKLSEKDVKTIKEVTISTSAINLFVSGGCAIVDIDLPLQSAFEYRSIVSICKNWLDNINNEKYDNQLLSFTLVPLLLQGQISIVFHNLTYYSGISNDNGYKIILAFDNNVTDCYEIDGIDYKAIKAAVANEIKLEDEALEKEIMEAEEEIKKLERENNPYLDTINEQYNPDSLSLANLDDENNQTETYKKYGIRFTEDDEGGNV